MSVKSPCIKCELRDNFNGLYTCNGCQKSFCLNHITDHSNELRNRFEEIINEYNSINDIFHNYKQNLNDFQWKIYEREKEINKIKLQINEYQKQSNYSEKDLDKWMIQLNKLKTKLTKTNQGIYSFIFKLNLLLNSKGFRICLISVFIILIAYYINPILKLNPPLTNIRFTEVHGPIQLLKDESVAEHNGPDFIPGSFRVNQIYSKGIHSIRLTLEKLSSSNTFIGIIESTRRQSISSSYGWFIGDKQIIYHKPGEYKIFQILKKFWSFLTSNQPKNYFQHNIKQGDTIEIEIDCINLKITLKNKRTKTKYELNIDLKQSPLPWQIIINLDRYGDRIRLY